MKLSKKQTIALDILEDKKTNVLVFGGAASGGKSYLGCFWIIKQCLKYPDSRHLIGRARLTTLKQSTLVTFFKVCKEQGLKIDIHFKYNAQSNEITFKNGSVVILKDLFFYPNDPEFDSLGGVEITSAYIDEGQQISQKAYNIVTSRLRHLLDKFGLIPKILITCNPGKNFLYKEFYKKSKENTLPDNHKFIQSLVSDNPHISSEYVKILNELPLAQKERLLYGNWEADDDPSKLIEYEDIINIFANDYINEEDSCFITCDVARMGKDKAVIMLWKGYNIIKLVEYDISKITELKDAIIVLKNLYKISTNNIIADGDGVGGGLVDWLKCKDFVNNSKALNDENYQNLKTQCYYKLADAISKNEIGITAKITTKQEESIIEELEQVKAANIESDGKLQIVSKSDIKMLIGRSPDYSDAMMMRMWFKLKPTIKKFRIR